VVGKWLAAILACATFGAGALPVSAPPTNTSMLTRPYTQFGFDSLRTLRSERQDGNVFLSPTSIAFALAMASNGASGTTREAILHTLHSDAQSSTQSMDAFNTANQALVEQISNTTAVQLSTANAVWVQQGFPVNPSFSQTLNTAYNAECENLDFHSPATVQTINDWVAKHTNNRIQRMVSRIEPSTVVMLANAIAFKGKWTLPFDPKDTQPHDFKTADSATHNVPLMKHTAEYAYGNTNGLETIRLPYADGTFAMYVVLPQDVSRMQTFLQELTADSFTTLLSSLRKRKGTIELPRFSITYEASLNAMLKKLGMGVAFSDNANFDGIHKAPPTLQISEVRHASFLQVDEEGTEASAATTMGIRALSAIVEPPPFHMIVDHPFFIAIRDERNLQILFTGIISNPGS
jgi:serine protease inhibitor